MKKHPFLMEVKNTSQLGKKTVSEFSSDFFIKKKTNLIKAFFPCTTTITTTTTTTTTKTRTKAMTMTTIITTGKTKRGWMDESLLWGNKKLERVRRMLCYPVREEEG